MADVFLSYAHCDRRSAARLAKALRQRGVSVYEGPSLLANLRPNAHWHQKIYDELDQAHAVLALFSYRGAARPWLIAEAAIADFQGKLITLALEPQATPAPLAHAELAMLSPRDLAKGAGPFATEEQTAALDRLAVAVAELKDTTQERRVQVLERVKAAPPAAAEAPEALANALPMEFGAAPGSRPVEQRRANFVAALRSLSSASNPDVRAAAQTVLADGRRADSIARLYTAASREQQPLVWRRFGETALPQGVYAALAGMERAGLSTRQINERISPQTSAGLFRARYGDRLFDAVGAAAFAALVILGGLFTASQLAGPSGPTTVASIPPMETALASQGPRLAEAPNAAAREVVRAGPAASPAPPPAAPAAAPSPASLPDRPRVAPTPLAPPQDEPDVFAAADETLALAAGGQGGPASCPAGRLTGATTVTIEPGDMLWRIAESCYGDPMAWRVIVECNPVLMRRNQSGVSPLHGGDLLYVGDRLVLPAPGAGCPI